MHKLYIKADISWESLDIYTGMYIAPKIAYTL